MTKKKTGLDKKQKGFMNHAKKELQKLRDCNFEEFREASVDFFEQILAGQLFMMEWNGQQQKKLFDMAVDEVKKIRAVNDADFKKADEHFQMIDKVVDEVYKKQGKAEATSLLSLMFVCGVANAMGKKGVITNATLNEGLKAIPKRVKGVITDTLEIKDKDFDRLLAQGLEATA